MIFLDVNVVMYRVGAPHPLKHESERVLRVTVERGERIVTDAEVYQEVLHRYRSMERPDVIQQAFDALDLWTDEVFPIAAADVLRAKEILLSRWSLAARDALHLAVMQRHGIRRIMSFDTDFDSVPEIERIS